MYDQNILLQAWETQLTQSTAMGGDTYTSNPEEQVVVDSIYTAIMEQRIAPKTKLSEAKLCEVFGVGRMRVRRALLLLASQGIVDLESNRGAFIACPSPQEANDVFTSRMLIEPKLVHGLCIATHSPDVSHLEEHIKLEHAARTDSDRSHIIRLSGEFHVKLASMSGNSVLIRIIRELVTRTSLIVGLFGDSGHSSCPDGDHANILAAIKKGEPSEAERLVFEHLQHIHTGLDLSRSKPQRPDLAKVFGME
ncbi:MAG: DNA-binding GntR family transcriptional regulator [Saprospiraceae bacterium]|mgnify:FL=1